MAFLFLFLPFALFAETLALYLSWYDDPTTTMAIQWHTPDTEKSPQLTLNLHSGEMKRYQASFHQAGDHLVYLVALQNLTPNTKYHFQIEGDPAIYSFRTAPASLTEPLRFIIGGDTFLSKEDFQKMCAGIIDEDPLFAVIGGDIAYAQHVNPFTEFSHFIQSQYGRWFSFLRQWKEWMIAPDGRVIPFLLVPGNHDLSRKRANHFFNLFAFPEKKLFRSVDFSHYLSLILLDTDHFDPIEGAQTLWLEKTLAQKKGHVSYLLPVYHEAAYPSYYSFTETIPEKIRKFWCPLFDEHQLPVAFENHNHTWKKTYPIKEGKRAASGTIYLGDGCWGVPPREPHKAWYLEKAEAKNNVYLVELTPETAKIQALTFGDKILDEITIHSLPLTP